MEKEKLYYQIRFWVPYREYVHVIDVEEFMDGVFGEISPRYYFEYYIYGRKHECYIDVKEMTLTTTPLEDDGETLIPECRTVYDDRFWVIEKIIDYGE